LDNLLKESPRQMPYMCFEHDEKQASLWASSFASGLDPVFNEPAIILTGKPSGSGAKAVNAKDWRSTSPSFGTNAEYTKCKCRRCDEPIKVCACEKPAFYFPDGVRGSEANPAQITGVDFVVGTLTNKPAFRAMPPVKARDEAGNIIEAGDYVGHEFHGNQWVGGEAHGKENEGSRKAHLASAGAKDKASHTAAAAAHEKAAKLHEKAGNDDAAAVHRAAASYHSGRAARFKASDASVSGDIISATDDLDTILAAYRPQESVDAILAKMEPAATRVTGFANDLDAMDAILAKLSGVAP
jgi:hypothetical protein